RITVHCGDATHGELAWNVASAGSEEKRNAGLRAGDGVHLPTGNQLVQRWRRSPHESMARAERQLVESRYRQRLPIMLGIQRFFSFSLIGRDQSRVFVGAGAELLVDTTADELAPGIRSKQPNPMGNTLLCLGLQRVVSRITGVLI